MIKVSHKWLVLWSLWACRLVRQPTQPLRVSTGLLRGDIAPDGSHVAYRGLPYATYQGRFKAPGPEPTWDGIYDATNENIRCIQRLGVSLMIGQDDCLVVNVYTPLNASPSDKLPVMVFIHGGGYYAGSGTQLVYGPKFLVSKGVILVTVNYRLNIQGFLCLRTKEAPGNAAMKDQVAALRWVQRNIRAFGGDTDNVTLFGESAGAASVGAHVVSPMSAGLFHKVIIQSGSATAAWALQFKPVYMASLLTKVMGYDTEDPHELYNILKDKSDRDLAVTRVPRKEGNTIVSEVLYAPCQEKVIEGEEPFLTEVPYSLLINGKYNKVPMMMGMNNNEGFFFGALENDTTMSNIKFENSLPKDLTIAKTKRKEIGDTLKKMYMGDDELSKETIVKFSKMLGELYFQFPILSDTEAILKTNTNPLYNYLFSYSGWRNLCKYATGKPFTDQPGATHADELFYLFNQQILPLFFEYKMIDRMSTLWTNFAKFSDPTPEVTDLLPVKWLPTDARDPKVFLIDEEFSYIPFWFTDTLKYWRELYANNRRTSD